MSYLFLEYERAACKASGALGLFLLNLNKAMTEMIALGNTACSAKLRETIDTTYRQLLSVNDKANCKENFHTVDELNAFDSLTRYEYKIETIESNLEKMGTASISQETPRGGKGSTRNTERSSRTARGAKGQETFLDIELKLFVELLGQRLAMEDLNEGFALQSLHNRFITSKEKSLSLLLPTLGHVDHLIFVTFNTSAVTHDSKNSVTWNEREESIDEISKKLIDIDEMSLFEFDALSDSDKDLYREKIVLIRSKDALNKRMDFQQRLSELRKEKKVKLRRSMTRSGNKGLKNLVKSKSRIMPNSEQSGEKLVTLEPPGKKKNETIGSSKSNGWKTLNEEIDIADGSDAYYSSLQAILSILNDWDPNQERIENVQWKVSKNLKGKNVTPTLKEDAVGATERFWIYYVKINDPRNSNNLNGILNEIAKNKQILVPPTPPLPVEKKDDLRFQTYFVARPKSPPPHIRETSPKREPIHLIALKPRTFDHSSKESLEINRSDSSDYLEEPLESRILLQPHEARTFKVYFSPKRPHSFQAEYSLGELNANKSVFNLKITGTGDIPRIDMDSSNIFHTIKKVKKDYPTNPTFYEDVQTFDFGPLLLTGKGKKAHRKKASFKFWNISKIDVELDVSLMASNLEAYNIKPKQMLIRPGEFGGVDVTAGFTNLGVNEDRLVLLVKDNPRVESIRLCNIGTKLEIALEGNNISFGRAMLYKQTRKNLIIHNNSLVPIFWKITPAASVDSQLEFTPSMSWTKPQAGSEVVFTYLANRIGTMDTITLSYDVFLTDTDDPRETLFTETITITGETYDVAVDVNFANPIDLGTVKVGAVTNSSFGIKNRGQYDVKFVIEFEKSDKLVPQLSRDILKNLMEDLQISPSIGNLVPDKIAMVNVTFHAKFGMSLRQVPLLRCNLIDANNSAIVVAEIPLTLSITSHYASFRLMPDSEISFGPVAICENKTLQLNVENTGFFPIKYHVKSAFLLTPSFENSSHKSKKEKSPKTEPKKRGTTKSQEVLSNLRLGAFTVFDNEGNINAGDTKTLTIDCCPQSEGHLEEKILIDVDDSLLEGYSGKDLVLKVDSSLPRIDFRDLDAIFPESYLVDDIQDFHCPKEIDAYTILTRNERCLYFKRVKIHKPHSTSMKLHNRGLVPARVTVHLRPDVLTPKNAKPDTFALDTVQECIPPMSSRVFSVFFTPSLIETYTGILEAWVELPDYLNHDLNKFAIKLSGEGCVPEIAVLEPSPDPHTGKRYIRFGRCLIDKISSRNIIFKNVGEIRTEVIIGIDRDSEMLYSVRKSAEFLNSSEITNNFDPSSMQDHRSVICTLSPDEAAQVTIDYRPKGISYKKAEIQFHVLDNPYEHLTVEIDGDGFTENVVLENLPLAENPRSNTSNGENRTRKSLKNRGNLSHSGSSITPTSRSVASTNLLYNLDYGTCPVNKMRRINFKIANTTADRDFRFEFSSHLNVVFEPSIGHLRSFEKKEITATFLVTEPITYKETILECAINEIRLPIEREEIRSWDDRQKTVEWIDVDNEEEDVSEFMKETSKQKMIVPTTEPDHDTLPTTFRTIQLIFSALAAYTEFTCITREIHFKDTLMFQNREYSFVLENPGNVDLFYYWKIDMEAGYSTRLPKISGCPSNLRPRSGKSDNSRPSSRASDGILYPEAEKQNLQKSTHSKFPREDEPRQTELNDLNYCERIALRDKSYIVDVEPFDCSTSSHTFDLFSDSFARTQRSSESWTENGDDQPFKLKPDIGVIPARESIQFTLRFSPLDVFAYKANLICQIENLDPNLEQPNIVVTARSLLPYCYFDIEESDYLTSGRRDPNVVNLPQAGGGDGSNEITRDFLDVRVVEFRVLGTADSHVKEFHLINPTTENYRFIWKDLTTWKPDELPYFHCTYEEGLAESGKRTNVVFSFFASTIGTFESYWRFSIDRYNLETLFLLVATVAEPSIHFAETRVKLKPTVMGIKVEASLTIVNDEDQQFSWKILPNTLYSEEAVSQTLAVAPTSGILQPTSKQILQVSLVPSCVGEFTFPLQCNVKGMKNPLAILVSARVNRIRPRILYSSTNKKQDILEARYDQGNVLNFGKLKLNMPATFKFEISNTSDIMFNYTWDLGTNDPRYSSQGSGAYFLTISKSSDHACSAVPSTCYLQLTALQKIIIHQHPVTLKIDGGPTYRMFVKASSKSPSVEFSFSHYNFGPSYIRGPTSPPYEAQLLVTNNDKTPAIIETQFKNSPHMTVDLDALSQAIPGNSNATILINFHPKEPSIYRENLVFHINDSTTQQTVIIEGEGIFYKIRLENIRDKFVEFGNVPVGKVVTRKIRLVNAARAPVDAWFDTINTLPAFNEDRTQRSSRPEESTLHSKTTNELPSRLNGPRAATSPEHKDSISDMLSVKPEHKISLPAGKSTVITVKFVATRRVSSFIEKIGVQVDSTVLPLFFVRGSCVAREFCLDRNHVYFGTVVEDCTKTAKLVLRNKGDFGARFKWNVSKLTHQFDLQPVSGYCSPGMDVTLDVTFHPKQLSPIVEAEATVDIEKHPSLKIKCSGACAKIPDAIEVIDFTTPVRSAKTKNLTIVNETNDAWNVKTALNGEYFRTEDIFVVPAKKTYSCPIVYSPLVMNTEKKPHEGRLIVKLPEGKQPLVYSLLGSSLPPKVEGKIVRQLPAKTKYAELLPAHNWLNRPQCFHCDIKLINDSQVNPVIYSFTGNLRLDVPAGGTRDYRATFHCYVETTLNFRITFTNDDGEYEFYEIQYKVSKPDTLSTIKLMTPARSTTRHQLAIENPLNDRPVIFSASCQHPDITIHNAMKVVTAKSTDKIIIVYSPLVPGENITKLNITCAELGNYPYEVKLKATPAPAGKVIRVTAMLGSSTNFPIIINNATKKNTEFTITVDDPSFTCNRKISIPPEKDGILEVNYEPCHAKNARAMLIATSQALGEIRFPLIGCYDPPKPQGPFTISQNTTTNIPFKNVFGITKTFAYVIDGANEFSVIKFPSIIKSKEVATISVKFSSGNGSSVEERQYPITGKLVVSYVEPTPSLFSWVYYLRGIR